MIYEFVDDDGNIIEQDMPMSEAPSIGSTALVRRSDGTRVRATRIASDIRMQQDNWKPYISHRLPRKLPGCKHTPDGKPIIETRQQEANIAAKHGYERE